MTEQEQEWVKGFEGLDDKRILAMRLPPNISSEDAFRFRDLQEEAAKAARQSREQALLQRALQEVTVAARLQPDLAIAVADD
jgi:hypothetical protein